MMLQMHEVPIICAVLRIGTHFCRGVTETVKDAIGSVFGVFRK